MEDRCSREYRGGALAADRPHQSLVFCPAQDIRRCRRPLGLDALLTLVAVKAGQGAATRPRRTAGQGFDDVLRHVAGSRKNGFDEGMRNFPFLHLSFP